MPDAFVGHLEGDAERVGLYGNRERSAVGHRVARAPVKSSEVV